MITDQQGVVWGTAKEIAYRLGGGVHEGMVRDWARKQGLERARMTDELGRPQVRYPYLQAAEIDRRLRHEGRGRKRALEVPPGPIWDNGNERPRRCANTPGHGQPGKRSTWQSLIGPAT